MLFAEKEAWYLASNWILKLICIFWILLTYLNTFIDNAKLKSLTESMISAFLFSVSICQVRLVVVGEKINP